MDEPLEISIVRLMAPGLPSTLPQLARLCHCPLGSARAAMGRLQKDGLVKKSGVSHSAGIYFYRGQKTATWYHLTEEGRKFHQEIRSV